MWDSSIVTTAGVNLLASWVEGTTLNICSAAGGTGTVQSSALINQTALVSQKQSASIISIDRTENTITVKIQFTAASTSYQLTQIGIFAKVDSGAATLLAIYQDENGVTIPAATSGQEFLYTFYGVIAIDNTGTLTVTIDEGAFVSLSTMNEALADKQDVITVTGIVARNDQGDIIAATPDTDYVTPSYLADVAHTGDYNDLENLPTIPEKTSELENDSGFVDETGLNAHNTNEGAHLNLWIPGSYYGTCASAESTVTKVVTITRFALKAGCKIVVKFTNADTATAPKLNVNSTGALSIVSKGQTSLLTSEMWKAGDYVLFQYDGTNWVLLVNLALRYVATSSMGASGGVASLDENGKVPTSQIPTLSYIPTSEKGAASGVASLGTDGKVPSEQLPSLDYIPTAEKAAAGGVASLADDGKVPASQLRGGFVISETAPSDTTLLWIDSSSVLRYYTGSAWSPVVPVWG